MARRATRSPRAGHVAARGGRPARPAAGRVEAAAPPEAPLDLLIEGGTIVDGTGAPRRAGSVGVAGGRLVLPRAGARQQAHRTLDATGLVVAPGFIDIHAHTDFWPAVDPLAESKAFDGVTLEVSGNCGFSAFPLDPVTRDRENRQLALFGAEIDWHDFDSYRERTHSRGTGIHRALFVGHGNLRKAVVGYDDRKPTAREMDRMTGILDELLAQGAAGFTTGLIYPPGCYARTAEIVELARVAARHGRLYASHIRGEGANLLASIDEVLAVAVESGARTQVSHLKASGRRNWHKIDEAIGKIESVRAQGYPVMADRYPYTATNTSLCTCLRDWAHEGGVSSLVARLEDPAASARMVAQMREDYPPEHFAGVMISHVPGPAGAALELEGRTVAEIAASRSADPYETVLWILASACGEVSAIFFTLNEEIMRRVLSLDWVMVASDATAQVPRPPYIERRPHPRSYGTFARVLGPLVRDEKLITLERAVAKMTGMPARQLGVGDRGLIREGYHADLAVFDPARIADRATYQDPHRASAGLVHLVVGGRLAIESGLPTGARAGEVLAWPGPGVGRR
jgi:N-acyl-D-amino-acid deacylase